MQASQLKIFDMATGRETASFPASSTKTDEVPSSSSSSSRRSPADIDEQPLLEPHGVCADRHGLVFVADRRGHAVRVFDERCGSVPEPAAAGGEGRTPGQRSVAIAEHLDEQNTWTAIRG